MKKIITLCLLVVTLFICCSTANASPIKYKGTIGPYEVQVSLNFIDGGGGFPSEYNGSYTYTKAGNTLRLEASSHKMTGTDIEEYTKKGVNSASWHLNGMIGDKVLKGTFHNNLNGKTFKINLKRTN